MRFQTLHQCLQAHYNCSNIVKRLSPPPFVVIVGIVAIALCGMQQTNKQTNRQYLNNCCLHY